MRYILFLFLLLSACATKNTSVKSDSMKTDSTQNSDPYLWLEEVEGPKALAFAKSESDRTIAHFEKNPQLKKISAELTHIALADDKLPSISLLNGLAYNFWQDKTHVRGIWRRTSLSEFQKAQPKWETLLDLDALAKKENENWVWGGSNCLPPENRHCLLTLSRGGKDASVVREFDLEKKEFVADGFTLPEAKSHITWIDSDTVYVGTDFGPGTLTDSGYPMISKIWKRGQPLAKAQEVFKCRPSDFSADSYVGFTEKKSYRFHYHVISFSEIEIWYEDEQGHRTLLPLPSSSEMAGIFEDSFLFVLRKDLKTKAKTILAGSLVALPISQVKNKDKALETLEVLFSPEKKRFLDSVRVGKSAIYLNILDNIQGKVVRLTHTETMSGNKTWQSTDIHFGDKGIAQVSSVSAFDNEYLISYTDFLVPVSIYHGTYSEQEKPWTLLKQAPSHFDAKNLVVERSEAQSPDGTLIPYFLVHKKNMHLNRKNPTLLYGYGGFEISILPFYLEGLGKVWLENDGVFVLSNLRGGSEFGPEWHQSVLREKRPKVYEDFIAVGEDLIKRKITSPAHLGIQGRSNGGLLTGATFVKRPDLFNAVLSEVPLLDMLRFHKLLAGASWMDEYGNPDDPKMHEVLASYSPYQNVQASVKYPEVFFMTSTKDDRVHPGHARKMVARMKEQGHPVYYYENTEGGHAGNANIQQKVLWNALEYTYLWEKLGN